MALEWEGVGFTLIPSPLSLPHGFEGKGARFRFPLAQQIVLARISKNHSRNLKLKRERFGMENCAKESVKNGFFYSVNVKLSGARLLARPLERWVGLRHVVSPAVE